MRRGWCITLASTIAASDLATKLLVRARMPIGSVHPVADGWFNIVHFENPGVVFGLGRQLGAALPWRLICATTVVAAIIAVMTLRTPLHDQWQQLAMHLILGGAIGNIANRILLGPVVDFLDFYVRTGASEHHWPAFNLADAAISTGAVMLVLRGVCGTTAVHEEVAR
jgi:signal peptidase II